MAFVVLSKFNNSLTE